MEPVLSLWSALGMFLLGFCFGLGWAIAHRILARF